MMTQAPVLPEPGLIFFDGYSKLCPSVMISPWSVLDGCGMLGGFTVRSRRLAKAFEFFLRRRKGQPFAGLVETLLEPQIKLKRL